MLVFQTNPNFVYPDTWSKSWQIPGWMMIEFRIGGSPQFQRSQAVNCVRLSRKISMDAPSVGFKPGTGP